MATHGRGHGLKCIQKTAIRYGTKLRLLVIGGQAILAYCGRIRVTKDLDIVTPKKDQGLLLAILKECGFIVEGSSFGLRAVSYEEGEEYVIHASVGDILDESRGHENPVVYTVPETTYGEGKTLALNGLLIEGEDGPPVAAVLPLPDLLLTKLLPIGRETDLEDVATLILEQSDQLAKTEVASRLDERTALTPIILERLEALAMFVREREVGKVWLGERWTPRKREAVMNFIRELVSIVR